MEFQSKMKNIKIRASKALKEYEETLNEIRVDKQKILKQISIERKNKKEIIDFSNKPEQNLPRSPVIPAPSTIYKKEKDPERERNTRTQKFTSKREVSFSPY